MVETLRGPDPSVEILSRNSPLSLLQPQELAPPVQRPGSTANDVSVFPAPLPAAQRAVHS